ncbi:MAG TPA: alpha/beta hydrolase-fold protein [Patescibacteria group bacterium]|nr:alpha/beta hydrolase-fold protein [Patescibacteria group bacterium]
MNLLSTNILLVICCLTTGLMLLVAQSIIRAKRAALAKAKPRKKKKPSKTKKPAKLSIRKRAVLKSRAAAHAVRIHQYTELALAITSGLALSLISVYIVRQYFASDQLPALLWLMLLPIGTTFSYLVISFWHTWQHILLALAGLVSAVAFGALLINQYYGYYPTLDSLFGRTNSIQTIVLHVNPTAPALRSAELTENSYEPANDQPDVGKLYSFVIPGSKSHFAGRPAVAYLPPAALTRAAPQLPVLILLAGTPGSPLDWLYGGDLKTTLDQFAARHNGLAPIVVLADQNGSQFADTECVNSPLGNAETYLTEDVPSYIKDNFNVSAAPSEWAIGGLSDGGMCALLMTLRHPTLFQSFLDFSGEPGPEVGNKDTTIARLFGGSAAVWAAHDPTTLLTGHSYPTLGGWFGIGDSDLPGLVQGERALYTAARQDGIAASIELVPGGQHTFYVWRQNLQDSLPWLANRMGLTLCETSCKQF